MSSADRGADFLDGMVIGDDFDWREWDVDDERDKVKPASAYVDEVLASYAAGDAAEPGDLWPWDKANDRNLRFRPGEVTIWGGINGHRKSMLTTQVAVSLAKQGRRVLIASLEMRPRATVDRMMRQSSGGKCSDAYGADWKAWVVGRVWLYDHLGICPPRQVLAVARYAAVELRANHIIIDSLMQVIAAPDDYAQQKQFIGGLCTLARAHEVHVHLVAHARKGKDEKQGIDKWSIKGASEIVDQVENVVLCNKKEASGDEPDQWCEIAKQRHGAWEGTLGLHFDPQSLSFGEQPTKRWPGVWLHDRP